MPYHNRQKWVILEGLARLVYLVLLCQNCYILNRYCLQETTHDNVMLDHNAFVLHRKETQFPDRCLLVPSHKFS